MEGKQIATAVFYGAALLCFLAGIIDRPSGIGQRMTNAGLMCWLLAVLVG
jgi:hypothetical protein